MIALYTRVSTQEQAESGHSIDEQAERLRDYCRAMRWNDFKLYTDAGYSGSSTSRPALQALIADVQRGSVDRVVVYKLDRLSRSQKDTLYLIEDVFLKHGADFISISENFDTASPFGKAMIGILAVFAQLEREQIRERMTMGRTARTKAGAFHGSGSIPIGYRYKDGELIIDEYEAELVRRIFQKAAAGAGVRTIVKELNESGLLHSGRQWNTQTVRNMLQRRTYLGEVSFSGQWYPGNHAAIIDRETFDTVQAMNAIRREKALQYNERLGRATSLLSGLVFCARCGARYTKQVYTHGKYRYDKYSCASRNKRNPELIIDPACDNDAIASDSIESAVIGLIRQFRLDPAYISIQQQKSPCRPDFSAKKQNIENQIRKLVELYAVDGIPLDALRASVDRLTAERDALEQVQASTEQDAARLQAAAGMLENLDDILTGGFEEKRALVLALIERIDIDGDHVSISWRFTP